MADDNIADKFEVEAIPDDSEVYMRAHRAHFRNGELQPGVFRDQEGGMSTEWSKYATPKDTWERGKVPPANAVIALPVRGVRAIETVSVEHDPIIGNRAHTNVLGEKTPMVRLALLRIYREMISLG